MKKAKTYIWLKTAGLFSTIIVMLLGINACKGRRHQTKYGPPSDYGYDEPVTKYGAPVDYDEDEFDEAQEIDTTAPAPDVFEYEESQTKYGVPPDYDDIIDIDTTSIPQ